MSREKLLEKPAFTTISGRPIERLYTPEDLADFEHSRDLGDPGQWPYTRGIHATLYRGKLWTMPALPPRTFVS